MLIDAQLHTAEDQAEHRPAPDLVAMMDAVGIDLAVLVQLSTMGFDNDYMLAAAERFPDRFVVVGALDPSTEDQEELLGRWHALPRTVGIRIPAAAPAARDLLLSGGFDAQLRAAERLRLPVFLFAPGRFEEVGRIAANYPELPLVLDHLGLPPPPGMDAGAEPMAALPDLLALAALPNVAVKCSGSAALSAEPYPFSDLWPHLHAVLEAFGGKRVMWGSDATRVASLHTYRDAVNHITETSELSAAEKQALLGDAVRGLLELEGR